MRAMLCTYLLYTVLQSTIEWRRGAVIGLQREECSEKVILFVVSVWVAAVIVRRLALLGIDDCIAIGVQLDLCCRQMLSVGALCIMAIMICTQC